MITRVLSFVLVLVLAFASLSCTAIDSAIGGVTNALGVADTATVIAKTAQIRTSYSVVAADLLEIKRGDTLDVLDSFEFEKVLWYRVRARDSELTEGWVEAQNVITSETLNRSRKLAEEYEGQIPQASGVIRSASNLRMAPDMTPENVLFKLTQGSTFDIMAWKFVPKQEAPDIDDAPKGTQKQGKKTKNADIEAAKEKDEPENLQEKYDIWYQVRLDPSVSPAPAGWLFGRQVELQVPSDIVFFQQNNKKFVTWQRLDGDTAGVGKASTPGSWVILTRTNVVKPIDGVEPDFDGILILAFDKYDQAYYTVWRNPNNTEVWGRLPLKVEGKGDNKTFTIQLRSNSGSMDTKVFTVFKDRNRMKVTPPEDIVQYQQVPVKK
ncbi:MAG TPA: hypothetical protein PKA82_06565 [Pyrinomonadaceae bacterium]|nr:hypothetical protein [Pyrinomonadaceae bacterium]